MIGELTSGLHILFISSVSASMFFWQMSINKLYSAKAGKHFMLISALILIMQGSLAIGEFYLNDTGFPPRFPLAILPSFALMLWLAFGSGYKIVENVPLKTLTLIHFVRLPVEIVLDTLFKAGYVPEIMTYNGANFDIFSGLTAPFIFWYAFRKGTINIKLLKAWNWLCLGLVLVIITLGISHLPNFTNEGEVANTAVLYFPFIWLPAYIVPAIVLSHLVALKKLSKMK